MAAIHIPRELSLGQRLNIMADDAKFEVGCDGDAESTALACASDIHGLPSLPKISKIYVSGNCIFNCAYCVCRCGRDREHVYLHSPREVAEIGLQIAGQNGRGVFISSAIYRNADYTQELIAESVRILRNDLHYNGYIHAKVMPGADPLLIAKTGLLANRLSVNIEVAQSDGYAKIAKQKNRNNILTPMGQVCDQIYAAHMEKRNFASSQVTQLMAGSTGEDDRTIMNLSVALYKKYRLKRVYYTAFTYTYSAKGYEDEHLPLTRIPFWRMARLYQADRLTQLYGFSMDDVTPKDQPFLQENIDPKAAWALRHLGMYPVEINRADYESLIRIPGIGITYAKRIIEARRYCTITHDLLKKMKVSLKRSKYFITCDGRYQGGRNFLAEGVAGAISSKPEQLSIASALLDGE